jgi:predicted glycogen debranching enzyme
MSSPLRINPEAEWLEADGLGGFASGTANGIRTRRYHALLLAATRPPSGRMVLVNGYEVWVETPMGRFALSSQRYSPDVIYPDGAGRIVEFTSEPWPRWTYELPDGTAIEHEILVRSGHAATYLHWRLVKGTLVNLFMRPLISGRDYHSLHHENGAFGFDAQQSDGRLVFRPYEGVPAIVILTNGEYSHQPDWYRKFMYSAERDRGLDCEEDLASPGVIHWDLNRSEATIILAAEGHEPFDSYENVRASEVARRAGCSSRLDRAADAYIVRRGKGSTIVAGYPWFTDWGRDTFISLRGICIGTGRYEVATEILVEWAGNVSEGMLPNRFPDTGDVPEYNSVDASLWFIVAAYELLSKWKGIAAADRLKLEKAIEEILSGYSGGTRFGIHADSDGLLAAGQAGIQLTWMDAKVGNWVVTPRIGKPVEVQALWLNALRIGGTINRRWTELYKKAASSFAERFWDSDRGYLADVIDVNNSFGTADLAFRPNQIFAVGGLPFAILDGEIPRRIVDAVEARLATPIGLRSLAPGEANYAPHYLGGSRERDAAYHQGTVWPWLMGPFVEAWVRVRGNTAKAKHQARERFLAPLLTHLDEAGLGHLPEIADGDAPHTPRGCPFQAWSVGEALRLQALLD